MKDLFSFLNDASINSDFKAALSNRGGFITFSNSGRRGGIKFFQIGLDSILQTLKDILNHLESFIHITEYEETPWRNNGSEYFTDPVANANSTVQTKPLFSTLSKIIMWANQPTLDNNDPDINICLDKAAIETTISKLEDVADSFRPIMKQVNMSNIDSRQRIYYGAPGTGKSYKIKGILDSNNVPKDNVFRTTFHPDSDYSTFVGAYKPTMRKHMDKIYTKEELISKLTEMKNGGVTYSPQKFGAKYWRSLKLLNLADKKDILQACGMSDNYTVEFDKGIAVGEEYLAGSEESRIIYSFVPQTFLNAYIRAYQTDNNVYLIIEEINRGNCAQIFGDLFQLLDRDANGKSEYTIKADADLRTFLEEKLGEGKPGIKDGELCLPPNLYIYATMNTSDQSLFPIDSAFKRRWDWEYEPIKYKNTGWKIEIDEQNKYSWVAFQKEVNRRIFDATHSEDKMLGDYFVNPANGVITADLLRNKILFYLWNDVCKDGEGDIFRTSEIDEIKFSDLYGEAGNDKLLGMINYLLKKPGEDRTNAKTGEDNKTDNQTM
ncbi:MULTISPECIES: type II restriction endonuclease subunit R [Bacteroidaceae]|jgi:hypothetical protein|uniref:type II restriction endonuclease subunit R n=1 Tax=Bacteroidaceae TaxID=815 RepID=UPI000B55A365|nr:type II restriction endonuclease subunit R [Phocaeicola dorei]OUO09080.1 hypothetical protein B5F95_08860 [Phocaeicola dorei]